MFTSIKFYLVSISLLLYSHFLSAQKNLSLSEAIQTCLANNYDITIQKKLKEVANNNNHWGEAGKHPNINFTLSTSERFSDNKNPVAFFTGIVSTFNASPKLSANWTIFDGFRVNMTKRKLEFLEQETAGNAEIVIQNTIQSLMLAYYKIILDKERLDIFEKVLNLSNNRYQYARIKKELGSGSSSDVFTNESSYLTDSINHFNQRIVYKNTLKQLNLLMNVKPIDQPYTFTDSLPSSFRDYDFADLQDKMLSQNANIKKEYISSLIALNNINIAKASTMPKLTTSLNYDFGLSIQDYSLANFVSDQVSVSEPILATNQNLTLGLELTFNLFNGGKIKRAIQNAVVQSDIAKLKVEQLQSSLTKDLSVNLEQYKVRRALKNIYRRSREVAAQNLQIMTDKFTTGVINSFDYRTVQNDFLLASLNDLQAAYNLIEMEINLMRLTGGILVKNEN